MGVVICLLVDQHIRTYAPQYAMEHALAHRNIDRKSAMFELAADAAVLLLKKSNSLSIELRANFLDRWGLLLGILTLLNRGALFFLWLASPTPHVYAMRRGKVLAAVRITRCIIFLGWLSLNRPCALHVPCFIARGTVLDAGAYVLGAQDVVPTYTHVDLPLACITVITTMLVMPFMARTRFVYHIPLQLFAIVTAVLIVSGPTGFCSVFERYANASSDHMPGISMHKVAPSSSVATPCTPMTWNVSALSYTSPLVQATPQGPGWLGVVQSVAVAPWQTAMWALDPDVQTTSACQSCVVRSTTDVDACSVLPEQFKVAHTVVRRVLGWMLALPVADMPGGDEVSACWIMCTFLAVVLSYAVACVLYWLELRHRLAFVRARSPNCRLHPGEQELASLVLMYQLVFMYFCITLTWMMLCVLNE